MVKIKWKEDKCRSEMLKLFIFGPLQGCYCQDLKIVVSYLDCKFLRSSQEDFPEGEKKKKH